MNVDELRIMAPEPERHLDGLAELLSKTFGFHGGNYFSSIQHVRRNLIDPEKSHYDWNATRIGVIGDQIVSHYGVVDYEMRIGGARVRTGGIGAVLTHPEVRNKGVMVRTANAAIDAMREAGYDMSALFGIPDFYHRFGYVRAWNEIEHLVSLDDLPTEKPTRRARKIKTLRRDEIDALYNEQHATLTGTAVRPTYLRHGNTTPTVQCWSDRGGRVVGYVATKPAGDQLVCQEAVGEPEQILRVLRRTAGRHHRREIKLQTIPWGHPLAVRVRQGRCEVRQYHQRRGGAMARTIHLASCLKKMTAELGRRLRAGGFEDWSGTLVIDDGREKAGLDIDRGKVAVGEARRTKHTIRGGDHVVQLLIGTHEPWETAELGDLRITGDARKLLPALLPIQRPMLSGWDRY